MPIKIFEDDFDTICSKFGVFFQKDPEDIHLGYGVEFVKSLDAYVCEHSDSEDIILLRLCQFMDEFSKSAIPHQAKYVISEGLSSTLDPKYTHPMFSSQLSIAKFGIWVTLTGEIRHDLLERAETGARVAILMYSFRGGMILDFCRELVCQVLSLQCQQTNDMEEKKQLIDEAFRQAGLVKDPETVRKMDLQYLFDSYVFFYLKYEGQSTRLRNVLEKALSTNLEIHGEDHELTSWAKISLFDYEIQTHHFKEALEIDPELYFLKTQEKGMFHARAYKLLAFAYWGLKNWKKADKWAKKGAKLAKDMHNLGNELRMIRKGIRRKMKFPLPLPKQATMEKEQKTFLKNLAGKRSCELCGEKKKSLRQCARCESVWYCCRDHQKKHWKAGHKKECIPIIPAEAQV